MRTSTQPIKRTRREELRKTCPGREMAATDWPRAGVVRSGERYCCEGCADGTGCTCEPRVCALTR